MATLRHDMELEQQQHAQQQAQVIQLQATVSTLDNMVHRLIQTQMERSETTATATPTMHVDTMDFIRTYMTEQCDKQYATGEARVEEKMGRMQREQEKQHGEWGWAERDRGGLIQTWHVSMSSMLDVWTL